MIKLIDQGQKVALHDVVKFRIGGSYVGGRVVALTACTATVEYRDPKTNKIKAERRTLWRPEPPRKRKTSSRRSSRRSRTAT